MKRRGPRIDPLDTSEHAWHERRSRRPQHSENELRDKKRINTIYGKEDRERRECARFVSFTQ